MKKVFNRRKGESFETYKQRAHKLHLSGWAHSKAAKGKWLPKPAYERVTGKPGRKHWFGW